MEYRLIDEQDRPAVEWLWAYCFEKRDDPFYQWYFRHYFQADRVVAGYDRGELVCCLHLNPYDLYLRGQVVRAAYIVGLATYPQARRGGAIRGLLAAALAEMRRQGRPVSILMPSRAEFYYPYQWLPCYHHLRYTLAVTDLRRLAAPAGRFTPVPPGDDGAALSAVYERFVAGRHGYVVRRRREWQNLLSSLAAEGGFVYLLQDDYGPTGYIMYVLRPHRLVVTEMAYTSQAAQRALWQFIYNHRSQAEVVEWQAPLNDLTYCWLPDPRRGVAVVPFMTGRLADVAATLTAITYPAGVAGQVTLVVQDDLAPWNDRVFHLTVRDGRSEVEPLDRGAAGVRCTAGALAQLVFGRLTAAELAYTGGLVAAADTDLALLERLFPRCDNYINEYF